MVLVEPHTQLGFLQIMTGGKFNFPAADKLSEYPYCVVTGCGQEQGTIIRYDAIETAKLPDFLRQVKDTLFTVSCFPSLSWNGATEMQRSLQEATEAAIVADLQPVVPPAEGLRQI